MLLGHCPPLMTHMAAKGVKPSKATAPDGYKGPYPQLCARVQSECREVMAALESMHGEVVRQGLTQPRSPQQQSKGVKKEEAVPHLHIKEEPRSFIPANKQEELGVEAGSSVIKSESAAAGAGHQCPPCGCDTSNLTVLDSLVRTILSQNTTDMTSARAFNNLKQTFPGGWEQIRTASMSNVADSIRVGGLADIKAGRIQAILDSLHTERGELSLEHLREMGDEEAKQELCKYKGVGPKTAACVLMFAMQRDEFPVDTHVLYITTKMGWVPPNASREGAYDHLNACLPNDVKHDLHVLLVTHGKVCCKTTGSKTSAKSRKHSKASTQAETGAITTGGIVVNREEDETEDVKGSEEAAAAPLGCPLRPWYQRSSKGQVVAAKNEGKGNVAGKVVGAGRVTSKVTESERPNTAKARRKRVTERAGVGKDALLSTPDHEARDDDEATEAAPIGEGSDGMAIGGPRTTLSVASSVNKKDVLRAKLDGTSKSVGTGRKQAIKKQRVN